MVKSGVVIHTMYSETGIAGVNLHLIILHYTPVVATIWVPYVAETQSAGLAVHMVVIPSTFDDLTVLLPDHQDVTLCRRYGWRYVVWWRYVVCLWRYVRVRRVTVQIMLLVEENSRTNRSACYPKFYNDRCRLNVSMSLSSILFTFIYTQETFINFGIYRPGTFLSFY